MALEALTSNLFSWVDAGGTTRTLNVDVVMASEDMREAKPTQHTVEDGSVIADHIVILPERVTFKLIVTQTPIRDEQGFDTETIDAGNVRQMSRESQDYNLVVRPSQFVPGGFLLISQGVRTVVSAVADNLLGAVTGGAVGNSTFRGSSQTEYAEGVKARVFRSIVGDQDRVNFAHEQLVEILNTRAKVKVSFKGRIYEKYHLLKVTLHEKPGRFGSAEFDVELQRIPTVRGEAVKLPAPTDFKTQEKVNKGNKTAKPKDPKEAQQGVGLTRRALNSAGATPGTDAETLGGLFNGGSVPGSE